MLSNCCNKILLDKVRQTVNSQTDMHAERQTGVSAHCLANETQYSNQITVKWLRQTYDPTTNSNAPTHWLTHSHTHAFSFKHTHKLTQKDRMTHISGRFVVQGQPG